MTDISVEQYLAGKTRSAKFENIGDTVAGTVTGSPRMVQRRDYNSNELLFHSDSGKPDMQMALTVQGDPDPNDSEDDGRRTLFVRGQMRAALIEEMRKVGVRAPEDGDHVAVTLVELRPVTLQNGKPGKPQHIHAVVFRKGAQKPDAAVAEFFGAQEAAAPATAPGLPVPPGVQPGKWAAMTDAQQRQMYDALGLAVPALAANDEPPF